MKGNSKIIILKDMGCLCMIMETSMKENGWKVECMEEAVFSGGMGKSILDSLIMIENMEEEFLSGLMEGFMMESGRMIVRMDRVGLLRLRMERR